MIDTDLTIRGLIKQLLNCSDIDAPVSAVNINYNADELEIAEHNLEHSIVKVIDNTDGDGDAVLYYLGDMPINIEKGEKHG